LVQRKEPSPVVTRLNVTFCAGLHGFNAQPKGSVLLTPQLHAIKLDYFNVRASHILFA